MGVISGVRTGLFLVLWEEDISLAGEVLRLCIGLGGTLVKGRIAMEVFFFMAWKMMWWRVIHKGYDRNANGCCSFGDPVVALIRGE